MSQRTLSLIVPVRDEPDLFFKLKNLLESVNPEECIVVDTSPHSQSLPPLERLVYLHRPKLTTRSQAMNEGASRATQNCLWFMHIDCHPPREARGWIGQDGGLCGAFLKTYDPDSFLLHAQAWLLNQSARLFSFPIVGTNAIFAERALFQEVGGYTDLPLLEDLDLIRKVRALSEIRISPLRIVVSSRNYPRGRTLRTMFRNLRILIGYLRKEDPKTLALLYHRGRSS